MALPADMYFLKWWAKFDLEPTEELDRFVAVLTDRGLAPTHFGKTQQTLREYSHRTLRRCWKEWEGNPFGLVFARRKAPRYTMSALSLITHTAYQSPQLDLRTRPNKTWPPVLFDLHRDYSLLLRPYFAALVPHFKQSSATWTDRAAINITRFALSRNGFPPVGARTWFGAEAVEQVGRELLLATPEAVVREEDDGSLQLDLSAEPWTLAAEDLLERARVATRHLQQSKAFGDYSDPTEKDRDRRHLWSPPDDL